MEGGGRVSAPELVPPAGIGGRVVSANGRLAALWQQRSVRGPAMLLGGRAVQLLNSLLVSVVLVRRFGLSAVGVFALGVVAMTVVGLTAALGLSAYLPRLKQTHAQSCAAALAIQLVTAPIWIVGVIAFAMLESPAGGERLVIVLVGCSGLLVALTNTGLMMSIMKARFAPGLFAPLCETAAVVIAAFAAQSVEAFALALLIGRSCSALTVWLGLARERIAFREIIRIGKASLPYMVPDALAMLSEQVIPLTLAAVVTRADLGVFRLCQQLLTAADTPGWSFVQAHYPDLVGTPLTKRSPIIRQVTMLGAAAAALCLGGSVVLAYFVFKVHAVAALMVALAVSLVWRYRNNLFDQALRASGWVTSTIALGAAKLVVGAAIAWPLVHQFKVWGAVAALTILSVASGVAYAWEYARRSRVAERTA